MKKLIGFIILFPLILILVLGYLGLVPYLSGYIGPKPKDLGIKISQSAYNNYYKKSGVKQEGILKNNNVNESIKFIGSHTVQESFSSEEISSMADLRKWVYFPFTNTQVRFNSDGSAEASGILKFNTGYQWLLAIGVAPSDIEKGMTIAKIPKIDLPFYVKVDGSVKNNRVTTDISQLEIGRITIPQNFVKQYTSAVERFVEDKFIRERPGVNIQSMTVQDSKIIFDGTLPDIEATVNQ